MKHTTDTYTNKPFRWNGVCIYRTDQGDFIVPQRMTKHTAEFLHPSRVPQALLAKLNNGKTWEGTTS